MNKKIRFFSFFVAVSMLLLAVNLYGISTKTSVNADSLMIDRENEIVLSRLRGSIYYENMDAIAGKSIVSGVFVDPLLLSENEITELKENVLYVSEESLEKKMSLAEPFYCNTLNPLNGEAFLNVSNNIRYASPSAQNLIGYTDESGGVCGIEKAYDDILSSSETYSLLYRPDAAGHVLNGFGYGLKGSVSGIDRGVVLTLNEAIQVVCDKTADELLPKGVIIVSRANTGEIVGYSSRPTFDPNNIEDSLDVDGALMNKMLEEFCCGSAFKIVVAAAALENSDEVNFSYKCTGSYDTGYEKIGCGDVHGNETLQDAFAVSCNSYFCNLAKQLGTKKIRSMALRMGFGRKYDIGGIVSESGKLPSSSSLSSPVALSNFSIGQGDLLVTPLQINTMTNVIANGGLFIAPTVVKGITEDGKTVMKNEKSTARRVISETTAEEIQRLMIYAAHNGTGVKALPCVYGAGAKTSTAETGIYENGREVYHTWVTGFVPEKNPEYTITVLYEGGESGYASASPVMAAVADGMIAAGVYKS